MTREIAGRNVEYETGLRALRVEGPDRNGDYAVLTTDGAYIAYENGDVDRSVVSFTDLLMEGRA